MLVGYSPDSERWIVRNPAVGLYQLIEEELARVERRVAQVAAISHPVLRTILEQVMFAPGKRVRPALTIASSRLFREGGESLYAMAAAVEFLHVATLIHDDVVD